MADVRFADVTKRFAENVVAVDGLTLDVAEGEFLILVGPSGCGKTTALRMVAGLEEITSGEIRIAERVVNDLPPTMRDVAMVFQNYALYPHMTVGDNIGFPLRQQKVRRRERAERVNEVARLLGLDELLDRRPRELSGGQRQRVAIGRALVRRPQVFLMDEPLSNLDAKLRVQMRAELISLHQRLGITTIYVTHDQTEAMTLGDRVVVLNRGVVKQVATPDDLYRNPANVFVAGFIGSPAMNFFRGRVSGRTVTLGDHAFPLPGDVAGADGDVIVGLRPEDVVLGGDLTAAVEITEHLGPEVIAHLRVDGLTATEIGERAGRSEDEQAASLGGAVVARFDGEFAGVAGEALRVGVRAERLQVFDAASGASLRA